jgi:transposase InsO family protein
VLESASTATDLALISYLRSIPDARMRRGVRFPAWYLLLEAVLGILSGCQSLRDLERFAIRHHAVLTEALGVELRRPPSDSSFRYFFHQVDVAALCAAIRDWTIAQIPGGAANLDQLVCDGKTLRGSIEPTAGLADRGLYIGSERSFYRVLHAHGQVHRRGRARPPQEPRPVPRLRAAGPNEVWSWDITYLPTSVRGVWLYLYQVLDVWSRKVVAWDVAEREDPAIAADLVSRACLRERISKGRQQPLILHADNGNAMRAATLECRMEELGVLRSFSRPRVSNDNPYSEALFRTAKYRPDYPSRPFPSKEEACQWVASFVDWYNHRHRHSGIKFVTPQQRHSGQAAEICLRRTVVYEEARQRNPRRWSRSVRCWHQPEVVWINPPPPEIKSETATLAPAA